MCGGDEKSLVTARCLVYAAGLHSLGDCFGDVLANIVDVEVAFQPRTREEPMEVGMGERGREAARLALVTWGAVGVLAQQQPGEPERDLLLADPAGSFEEQAARQRPSANDVREALAKRVVSVERKKRQGSFLRERVRAKLSEARRASFYRVRCRLRRTSRPRFGRTPIRGRSSSPARCALLRAWDNRRRRWRWRGRRSSGHRP